MSDYLVLWITHFFVAAAFMGSCYVTLLVTLLNREISKMTYWDEQGDNLKAFLSGSLIKICSTKTFVALQGRLDDSSHNRLSEYVLKYNQYKKVREDISRVCSQRAGVVGISVVLSILYATSVLLYSISVQVPIEVSQTIKILGPVIVLIFIMLWFLPIYIASNQINDYISKGNTSESKIRLEHGEFSRMENWELKS